MEGAVILTNLKCYLLQADNGVKKVWETSYKSVGAKESKEMCIRDRINADYRS